MGVASHGYPRSKRIIRQKIPIFPKYHPAYFNFSVVDNRIYFIMFPDMLKNKQIIFITDEKGNLLKKKEIDALDYDIVKNNVFCIYKEDMYYLKPDQKTGIFYIHIINLAN